MTAGIHIVGGDLEAPSASVGGVCDGLWGLDVAGAVGGVASAMPGSAISGCRADEDMYGPPVSLVGGGAPASAGGSRSLTGKS